MPEVTVEQARPCTPVGYEVVDTCVLAEDVKAGDLLQYTGNESGGLPEMQKAPAGSEEAHGIAMKDGYSGQGGFDVGVQGEMDGFSGLNEGDKLWPSGATAGKIDTTQPTDGSGNPVGIARIRAVRPGRIRFMFL